MRIGFVSGEYPPLVGGVGAFTQRLADALAASGHQVFVLTDLRGSMNGDSVMVSPLIQSHRWNWRIYPLIRRWARERQIDIINLQYQTAAYGMSPWIHFLPDKLHPMAFVTTFHDLRFPYLFPKAGRLRDWIVRHLATASTGVIATNHEDYAHLKSHPLAAMIPIGSNIQQHAHDRAQLSDWRARMAAQSGEFLIAFFGFINASKGIDTLLDALALAISRGRRWRLAIIGDPVGTSDPTNADYVQQIGEQIRRLGLTESVITTGFVDDAAVAGFLAAADAIALPYRDGVSLRRGTLMAALNSRTPIVTTIPRVPMPELDDSLLMVPAEQPEALYQALTRLEDDPTLGQRLSAHAHTLAASFGWERIARLTAEHFERVLEAARHRN
jgi:glycosyltransferase involved in cell wall biosynthesis